MAVCSCGNEFDRDKSNGYCRKCHAKYMREHRPSHGELNEEQRKKANCRSYANVYKRRGLLVPEPCADCEDIEVEMHHKDYDKPLDVVWICRVCHLARHEPAAA